MSIRGQAHAHFVHMFINFEIQCGKARASARAQARAVFNEAGRRAREKARETIELSTRRRSARFLRCNPSPYNRFLQTRWCLISGEKKIFSIPTFFERATSLAFKVLGFVCTPKPCSSWARGGVLSMVSRIQRGRTCAIVYGGLNSSRGQSKTFV